MSNVISGIIEDFEGIFEKVRANPDKRVCVHNLDFSDTPELTDDDKDKLLQYYLHTIQYGCNVKLPKSAWPFFLDHRRSLGTIKVRELLIPALSKKIHQLNIEQIVVKGVGGLYTSILINQIKPVNILFVRGARHDHGKQQTVEGSIDPSKKVWFVDDTIHFGGTLNEVYLEMLECRVELAGVLALFDYSWGGHDHMTKHLNLPKHNLVKLTKSAQVKLYGIR